jgi:hypothetical protein
VGFGLHRIGLKSPDEKRAMKSMARAPPYSGFGLSEKPTFFELFFNKKLKIAKNRLLVLNFVV